MKHVTQSNSSLVISSIYEAHFKSDIDTNEIRIILS